MIETSPALPTLTLNEVDGLNGFGYALLISIALGAIMLDAMYPSVLATTASRTSKLPDA